MIAFFRRWFAAATPPAKAPAKQETQSGTSPRAARPAIALSLPAKPPAKGIVIEYCLREGLDAWRATSWTPTDVEDAKQMCRTAAGNRHCIHVFRVLVDGKAVWGPGEL